MQGPAAGIEFHRQGDQLEHQRQAEAGNAQIDQGVGEGTQDGEQQANQDQGHGQTGAKVGHRDDGCPELDGGVAFRVLHRVARFMAGNADGGGGGVVVNAIGKADDVGFGIIVVCQIAADPLDADAVDAIGPQHPLGGFRAGELPQGILLGVFFKGGIDVGAGPERQNQAGQDKHHIGPVKTVIIVGHRVTS